MNREAKDFFNPKFFFNHSLSREVEVSNCYRSQLRGLQSSNLKFLEVNYWRRMTRLRPPVRGWFRFYEQMMILVINEMATENDSNDREEKKTQVDENKDANGPKVD